MKNRLIGIALAVALLVAGGIVGAVVDRNWVRSKPAAEQPSGKRVKGQGKRHKRMLKRFRKRLGLSDDQVSAVSKILTESRGKMRQARKQARQDIRKLLNPEQVQKYDKMLERRRQRRRARRGRRGPRGPRGP